MATMRLPSEQTLPGVNEYRGRRFDAAPSTDDRSLNFPVRLVLPEYVRPVRKVWRRGSVLDQGPDGACFAKGVHIRMADGSQRLIEDVRLLDEVVTAEGRTGPVTHLFVRRANRGLVSVGLYGHVPLRCTPEHPILTARGYVAAEDLIPGDEVAITRHLPTADDVIDVAALVDTREMRGILAGEVNTGGVVTRVAPLPSLLARTPSLGRLIGLYAAEGHTTANKTIWTFGSHESETLVPDVVALCKAAFDAEARVQHRPNGAVNVVLYGKTWMRLFETLVPGTTKHGDKRLSGHVTHGSREYLTALLDGWVAGDGYTRADRKGRVNGVSVSRNLALDMHAIATSLGYRPALRMSAPHMNRHAATRQTRYDVEWTHSEGGQRSARLTDAAHWRKVTTVTAEAYDGWVYNLEVEGDHSYVADGVGVHNCVGHGWAAELAGDPVRVNLGAASVKYPAGDRPDPFNVHGAAHWIYRAAQHLDEWEGVDYSGTSVLAGAKVCQSLGLMDGYRWARTKNDVRDTLITVGPVVIAIPWLTGMFEPVDGELLITGEEVGWHCVLVNGYDPALSLNGGPRREMARVLNSWGTSWGEYGSTWTDFGALWNLIEGAAGDVCVPVGRRA